MSISICGDGGVCPRLFFQLTKGIVMDTYAPPVTLRPAKSYFPVIVSGLGTTVLTLLGVYLMDTSGADFNVMGWR